MVAIYWLPTVASHQSGSALLASLALVATGSQARNTGVASGVVSAAAPVAVAGMLWGVGWGGLAARARDEDATQLYCRFQTFDNQLGGGGQKAKRPSGISEMDKNGSG